MQIYLNVKAVVCIITTVLYRAKISDKNQVMKLLLLDSLLGVYLLSLKHHDSSRTTYST
jgi:hypothetical protein